MDKGYIKILIAISVVLIISIILVIILLMLNINNDSPQTEISVGDAGEEVDFSAMTVETVTEKIDYYTVRNCINNYLNYLNSDSSIYYIGGEMNIDIQKEYIYNLLSSEYIEEKNITLENLLNNIEITNEEQIFIPLQMKVLQKENVNKFIAYGIIQTVADNRFIKEAYFIVNLDYKNKTFSIEPIEEEYTNIDEIELENNNISINSNDDNKYTNQKITNEYVTKEYFALFKKLAISNPEIIYNKMPKQYREVRFGSLSNFEAYINNNLDEIKKITLKEYMVNNYEGYIEYVGRDQFGNLYIFNEYKDQTLDIKLDTYTITTDKFIQEYAKGTEQKKVQMNIDKFIQMINRHDYISSYNCISESFKNNYFPTQQDFENSIKYNFFNYNNFEFKNFEKKGSNIYVCTVQISDLTNEIQETRDINIIMQLNDSIDFEMSFGM